MVGWRANPRTSMSRSRVLARSLGGAAALALAALSATAPARAESFAGSYRPSPLRIEAQVSAWGVDCGTRPQSQVIEQAGKVEVRAQGAHLLLRFSDRSVRTDACWSPNPAVKLVSATAVEGRFRATCKTTAGDAKRESGQYSLTATPGRLELVEESDYDWQLNQSHCVAKVRITQTLVDAREAAPPAPPVADAGAPPAPVEKPACTPGPVTRLRLRPSEARVAPGERVCFTIKALDAAGCPSVLAADALTLSLTKPSGAQGTLQGTCFKTAPSAALAEGVFKVVASTGNVRSEASVTVSALDLSDITARRGPSGSGPIGASGPINETPLESGIRAVASGSHGLLWLGVSLAGLASLLSLLAIGALRALRRQARATEQRQSIESAEFSAPIRRAPPAAMAHPVAPAATPAEVPAVAAPAKGPQRVCPKCRRGYAPGTARCAADGEALLDYGEFMKRAQEGDAPPRACPQCGGRLAAGAMFCGLCGHKL
jgi:hypothetical protein